MRKDSLICFVLFISTSQGCIAHPNNQLITRISEADNPPHDVSAVPRVKLKLAEKSIKYSPYDVGGVPAKAGAERIVYHRNPLPEFTGKGARGNTSISSCKEVNSCVF